MKFDLISDLHGDINWSYKKFCAMTGLEWTEGVDPFWYPWHLHKQSDILVVAGDTANDPFTAIKILDEASNYYERVIFTDGNHEHYWCKRMNVRRARQKRRGAEPGPKTTVGTGMALFRTFAQGKVSQGKKVTYLEPGYSINVDGTLVLGGNNWYNWMNGHYWTRDDQHAMWRKESNDPREIRFDKNGYPNKMALRSVEYCREMVELVQNVDAIKEIVLVFHTAPDAKGCNGPGQEWYHLSGSYVNSHCKRIWEADTNKKIKLVVNGHIHDPREYHIDHIRVRTNPRGYERFKDDIYPILINTEEVMGSGFGEIES